MLVTTHRRASVALLLSVTVVAASLGPTAWAAGTLDQEQAGTRDNVLLVFAGRDQAQSFVAGRTGRLDHVDLRLGQNAGSDSTKEVAVRIQGAEGFLAVPTPPVLGETGLAAKDVTPDFGWTSIDLAEPVQVTQGQSYAIVLSSTVPNLEAFTWATTNGNPYAGGIVSNFDHADEGAQWNPQPDYDLNFRTYVDPGADADADGFGAYQECDDSNVAVNPGATETYNQVDDNCDGQVDEGFTAPTAPGIGTASSGATGGVVNATARWTRPVSNGGVPVGSYRVQAQKLDVAGAVVSREERVVGNEARSIVVRLSQGRYRFRVAATNAEGRGPWSAVSNVVRAR